MNVYGNGHGHQVFGPGHNGLDVGIEGPSQASMNQGPSARDLVLNVEDPRAKFGVLMLKRNVLGPNTHTYSYFEKYFLIFQRRNHFPKFKYNFFAD